MREWLKKYGVSILLILVAAVLLVQVKIMGDLQALQGQIQIQSMGPDSLHNIVSMELSGMQARMEETLQREASALSSFQWTQGELDPDTLKASLSVTVTPKEVAADTRVRVQPPGGETITLKREGVTFTGTVQAGLFDAVNFKVLLDRGGVTTVEEPEQYTVNLWEFYLPRLNGGLWYSASKKGSDGTVFVNGNAYAYEETKVAGRENAIQTLSLRCTMDAKELWSRPFTPEEGGPPELTQYLVEFQGVERTPEQVMDLVLLATDRYGLVYHYRLPDHFLNAGPVNGSSSEFFLAAIYQADGTLLYQN